MDGRQRVGRQRPRPLDWVVASRPPLSRRAAPPRDAGPSFQEWLSSFWSPGLRVLEIAEREPSLLGEAVRHRAAEFVCLTPPGVCRRSEAVGRLGWALLQGQPEALTRLQRRFDLVAWLREEDAPSAMFDVAERLLHPDGLLAIRAFRRLDARLASRWRFGEVASLADGSRGVIVQRRRLPQAA